MSPLVTPSVPSAPVRLQLHPEVAYEAREEKERINKPNNKKAFEPPGNPPVPRSHREEAYEARETRKQFWSLEIFF